MNPENTNDSPSEDSYISYDSDYGSDYDSDYVESPQDCDGSGTAQNLPVGSVELWDACRAGHAHTVRRLLSVEGIDIEMGCNGTTPLLAAVMVGATEVVELLLRGGANASFITAVQGSTSLHTAITGGGVWFGKPLPPKFVDILKLLLAYNPDRSFVESVGYKGPLISPFTMAVHHDHIEVVRVLVKHGVDVNRVDLSNGQLPISRAVRNGNFDMVRLLIAHGADVMHRDFMGNTVLRCAVWRAEPRIFELLIENGLDINAVDNEGRSILHWAGHLASVRMTKFLLSKPVVLEAKSTTGKTPVEYACSLNSDCSHYMYYYPLDYDIDGRECDHHQIGLRDKVCQLMQSEIQRRAQCEAFAMGHHPRLGAVSQVAVLHPDVLRMVLTHV